MLDNNWEMINGPVAHRIEILNATNQVNVLESLILFMISHRGPLGNGNPPMPDEGHLCDLHHAGTLFLLASPGEYRNCEVHIAKPDGEVVHQPPNWQSVEGFMQNFFRELSSIWGTGDALDIAAFALWKINWIHPFRNGNGRTARAFSYACLCIKIGILLPGRITIIDQIMTSRPDYERVLSIATESVKAGGLPNLAPIKEYLNDLLSKQMASIMPDPATSDGGPA